MVQLTRLPIVLATAAAAIQQQGFVGGNSSIQTYEGTGICPAPAFPPPFSFGENSRPDSSKDPQSRKYEVCPAHLSVEASLIEQDLMIEKLKTAIDLMRKNLSEDLKRKIFIEKHSSSYEHQCSGTDLKETKKDHFELRNIDKELQGLLKTKTRDGKEVPEKYRDSIVAMVMRLMDELASEGKVSCDQLRFGLEKIYKNADRLPFGADRLPFGTRMNEAIARVEAIHGIPYPILFHIAVLLMTYPTTRLLLKGIDVVAERLAARMVRREQIIQPYVFPEREIIKRIMERALHIAWPEMNELETNEPVCSREEWDQVSAKLKHGIEVECHNKPEVKHLKDSLLSIIDLVTKLERDRGYYPCNDGRISEGELINLLTYLRPIFSRLS